MCTACLREWFKHGRVCPLCKSSPAARCRGSAETIGCVADLSATDSHSFAAGTRSSAECLPNLIGATPTVEGRSSCTVEGRSDVGVGPNMRTTPSLIRDEQAGAGIVQLCAAASHVPHSARTASVSTRQHGAATARRPSASVGDMAAAGRLCSVEGLRCCHSEQSPKPIRLAAVDADRTGSKRSTTRSTHAAKGRTPSADVAGQLGGGNDAAATRFSTAERRELAARAAEERERRSRLTPTAQPSPIADVCAAATDTARCSPKPAAREADRPTDSDRAPNCYADTMPYIDGESALRPCTDRDACSARANGGAENRAADPFSRGSSARCVADDEMRTSARPQGSPSPGADVTRSQGGRGAVAGVLALTADVGKCTQRDSSRLVTQAIARQACCPLPVVRCLLHVACCLWHAVCCTLSVARCMLSVACCMLHAVCCMLSAACCLLPVARCIPFVAHGSARAAGRFRTRQAIARAGMGRGAASGRAVND